MGHLLKGFVLPDYFLFISHIKFSVNVPVMSDSGSKTKHTWVTFGFHNNHTLDVRHSVGNLRVWKLLTLFYPYIGQPPDLKLTWVQNLITLLLKSFHVPLP